MYEVYCKCKYELHSTIKERRAFLLESVLVLVACCSIQSWMVIHPSLALGGNRHSQRAIVRLQQCLLFAGTTKSFTHIRTHMPIKAHQEKLSLNAFWLAPQLPPSTNQIHRLFTHVPREELAHLHQKAGITIEPWQVLATGPVQAIWMQCPLERHLRGRLSFLWHYTTRAAMAVISEWRRPLHLLERSTPAAGRQSAL